MEEIKAQFRLHQAQKRFRDSKALYRGFVGGRGAGKTWIGSHDMVMRAKGGRAYLIASPTSIIMGDTTLPTFLDRCRPYGLVDSIRLTPYPTVHLTTGAEIRFRTAEDPERLRGPNLSGAWLDEASLMREDAFSIVIACLREGGEQGWLSATFTPKGKANWTYKQFGTGMPNTECFNASTKENPFNPPTFEDTLRSQYTSHFARQELGGEFLDPAGSIFQRHWFKPANNPQRIAARVRYWDKAATEGGGCFTAGVLIAKYQFGSNLHFTFEDVVRGQWSAGARNDVMKQTADLDRRRGRVVQVVEQEPGSGGKESAEFTVRLLAGHEVKLDKVTGSKEERAMPLAAQAEAGNVYYVDALWNAAFLDELAAFPDGEYADQADAASGAFNHVAAMPVGSPLPGVPTDGRLGNVSEDAWR